MKKTNSSIILYIAIIFALFNIITVFFNWINLNLSANINLINLNQDFPLKTISGIQLPGGFIGLFFALVFIFLTYKHNKLAVLFGVCSIINGIGYAFGWFVNKTELLNIDIFKEYATAKIVAIPQIGLYTYIISAITFTIISILLFYKTFKKFN